MFQARLQTVLLTLAAISPSAAGGQIVFDWPLRAGPQPEAVLTGAGAVFWNPGGLVQEVGTQQELWVLHVDGPDVTGVRGAAVAGVVSLPMGFQGGIGYWHLGIEDIPRTTTSPSPEAGEVDVTEDVAHLTLSWNLGAHTGIGGAIRFQRGAVGSHDRTRIGGEVGIHHRAGLPLKPRLGLVFSGLGGDWRALAGFEVALVSLASSRIPIHAGYGFETGERRRGTSHRLSLRGSWMDQFHVGAGLSYLGKEDGWIPLWMLGADIGRFSLSVLRESLANHFGPVHFFQASLRFPTGGLR